MNKLISSLKAERRKIIESFRIYGGDAWRKSHFFTWLAYLLNQYLSFLIYSIRNLNFRLPSSLKPVKTGSVANFKADRFAKDLVFDKTSALGFIVNKSSELKFWVSSFNYLYNNQTPECRNYNSMQLSLWIRDILGDQIRSFIHSDYQIISIRMYKTLSSDQAETPNVNSRFHTDDLLPGCFRLILYLCDVDNSNGPFLYTSLEGEVFSLKGPAGTFVMFRRYMMHADSSVRGEHRYSMLINICPAIFPGWELSHSLNSRPSNLAGYKNPFRAFESLTP